jgi:hypothetical protein
MPSERPIVNQTNNGWGLKKPHFFVANLYMFSYLELGLFVIIQCITFEVLYIRLFLCTFVVRYLLMP